MTSINNLKLFTFFYINEQDKLTISEKKYLYNFVEKANEQQIKNLLLTGNIVENLEEIEFRYGGMPMNDLWKALAQSKGYSAGLTSGVGKGLAVSALVALSVAVAAKTYKRFFSKEARACQGLKGVEKTNCMIKAKKLAQQAKIKELEKGLALCTKSKKPGTCSDKIKHKIAIEKAKLGDL